MDLALEKLAEHGVMGLIAAVFMYLYIQESRARIQDAKDGLALALSLQSKTAETIDKVRTIWEETRRQDQERRHP